MATLRGRVSGGAMVSTDATGSDGANPALQNRGWFDHQSTSTWSLIWFVAAIAWLAFMYFGHGGSRGAVL